MGNRAYETAGLAYRRPNEVVEIAVSTNDLDLFDACVDALSSNPRVHQTKSDRLACVEGLKTIFDHWSGIDAAGNGKPDLPTGLLHFFEAQTGQSTNRPSDLVNASLIFGLRDFKDSMDEDFPDEQPLQTKLQELYLSLEPPTDSALYRMWVGKTDESTGTETGTKSGTGSDSGAPGDPKDDNQ